MTIAGEGSRGVDCTVAVEDIKAIHFTSTSSSQKGHVSADGLPMACNT
jgi:hypothetical protein